jgi:hypothetical protein
MAIEQGWRYNHRGTVKLPDQASFTVFSSYIYGGILTSTWIWGKKLDLKPSLGFQEIVNRFKIDDCDPSAGTNIITTFEQTVLFTRTHSSSQWNGRIVRRDVTLKLPVKIRRQCPMSKLGLGSIASEKG